MMVQQFNADTHRRALGISYLCGVTTKGDTSWLAAALPCHAIRPIPGVELDLLAISKSCSFEV